MLSASATIPFPTLRTNQPHGTVAYMGGVPCILERFLACYSQMQEYNQDFLPRLHYDHAGISYHAAARNKLASRMRGEWLVMLDTDHEFEPDLIARLLNTATRYDIDVLTGLYQYKHPPHAPVLYGWINRDNPLEGVQPISSWDRSLPVFTIDSAGAGTLFVRRRVFDRIRNELKQRPFDPLLPLSEDNSFFYRLKQLGIPAWVDTRIQSYHLQVRGVHMDDFDQSAIQPGRIIDVQACEVA